MVRALMFSFVGLASAAARQGPKSLEGIQCAGRRLKDLRVRESCERFCCKISAIRRVSRFGPGWG